MSILATCIHAYIHTYMHACMHACIHMYILTYMHACLYTHTRTYVRAHIHAYIHIFHRCIYIHSCMHTCRALLSTRARGSYVQVGPPPSSQPRRQHPLAGFTSGGISPAAAVTHTRTSTHLVSLWGLARGCARECWHEVAPGSVGTRLRLGVLARVSAVPVVRGCWHVCALAAPC